MAFKRWGLLFDGPWPNTDILEPRTGIWVIWCCIDEKHWSVTAAGETRNVRKAVLERIPPLKPCHYPGGSIHFSAAYPPRTSQKARREIVERIIATVHWPCGGNAACACADDPARNAERACAD
ncbi:MAG: hypothetical protein WCP06_13310 [Verrucomicrobiota bacterium]